MFNEIIKRQSKGGVDGRKLISEIPEMNRKISKNRIKNNI